MGQGACRGDAGEKRAGGGDDRVEVGVKGGEGNDRRGCLMNYYFLGEGGGIALA